MTPALELRDVSVIYLNGVEALKSHDLKISNKQVTVLLGPSGAGKSTLLRTMNLLVQPSTGTVTSQDFGDLSSRRKLRKHRFQTAMIFQQHHLIGRRNALENVLTSRLGRYSFLRSLVPLPKVDRIFALDCLSRVGLFDKALCRCDSLSGGQQQRVGIARALAQEPKMILADEPVASLDPASSLHVLSLLRDICIRDGIPAVISLHQIEYAREFADRIVGLFDGKIVFDGPPEKLDQTALEKIYGADFGKNVVPAISTEREELCI